MSTLTWANSRQVHPLDEKVTWLAQRESNLRWDNCISLTLGKVFPLAQQEQEVREQYHKFWKSLHEYAHPSVTIVSRMMEESALLVTDSFDERWAMEIIEDATKVFDLIWLAVISRFPRCAPLLAQQEHGLICPLTQAVLEKMPLAD